MITDAVIITLIHLETNNLTDFDKWYMIKMLDKSKSYVKETKDV